MAKVNLQTKSGIDKNGKPWTMVTAHAGKFHSEPIFVSEIEAEYLVEYLQDDDATFELER
jgi:hypothetical protein